MINFPSTQKYFGCFYDLYFDYGGLAWHLKLQLQVFGLRGISIWHCMAGVNGLVINRNISFCIS